jgi:hypothetical protein
MKLLLPIVIMLAASCAHQPETIVIKETEYVFVDIQTYNEWGTTRLTPVGRRPIPTLEQACSNDLWKSSTKCRGLIRESW